VDTHCHAGYDVKPFYDSMIAKLIVHQPDRPQALACLRRALSEFVIQGIHTTIPLYKDLIQHARYVNGDFNVHFVEEFLESG
jgi:acetyl-CoA carboxylase biotin carboxylase subunit